MKARVLCYRNEGSKVFGITKIYLEPDFNQCISDLRILTEQETNDKIWMRTDVDIFNPTDKQNPKLFSKLLECCKEAKAVYESMGINANNKIVGEYYTNLIEVLKIAEK